MKTSNPKNYRKMSEPFPDADTANQVLSDFFTELSELREKYRVADVLCIVAVNVQYDETEGRALTYFHAGDELNTESLAAYGYGRAQAERREVVNQLLSGKTAKL